MSITNSPVVELRQYTLKPGARDTLVEIFEAEFVESQEELGTDIGGIFHDRDDPDRFVWMRGFASMEARKAALDAFYYGPVWKEHAAAANATMIDSDDVLLLRPTDPPHPPAEPGPASAGRGERHVRRVGPGHRLAARTRPRHLRLAHPGRPPGPRPRPRHGRRHLAHRTRREHLPRPARPPRPRLRLDGHVRRRGDVRRRPRRPGERPRLAAYPRRARPPRRHHPDPQPPPHRPVLPRPAGIVRNEAHHQERV